MSCQFPKQCGKCAKWVKSATEWAKLKYRGIQPDPFTGKPELEYRDCSCNSTLAVEVMS